MRIGIARTMSGLPQTDRRWLPMLLSIDELLGALHSNNVNVDEVAIAYITTDAV